MARTFDGDAANRLTRAATPVTAAPLTLACWYFNLDAATIQALITIPNSVTGDDWFNLFYDGVTNVGQVGAGTPGGAISYSGGGNLLQANAWQHVAGVFTSPTSRLVYLNGTAGTPNTTDRTPPGLDALNVGCFQDVAVFQDGVTGALAHVAIWNAALTAAEVALLAAGWSPRYIRGASCVTYYPFCASGSLDSTLGAAQTLTETGSIPVADNPPFASGDCPDDAAMYVVTRR